jgi:hypothetical protein
MKKPEKPKTDNWGWIKALLFPKKARPVPKPQLNPTRPPGPVTTHPAQKPPQPVSASPAAGVATRQPVAAQKPAVVVTAPPPQGNPPKAPLVGTPKPMPVAMQSQVGPPKPATTMNTAPHLPAKPLRQPAPHKRMQNNFRLRLPRVQRDKLAPAFWHIAGGLSFIVNIILIIVLVLLARELFALKSLVGDHLLGGLYANFILMDKAKIETNITVEDNIAVNFPLPISQDTVVTLTENTAINGATVRLNTGGVAINSLANIVLPAGTNLPVHLEMTIPVNTTIPIKLTVPVKIPLEQTELHTPFIGLQQVVHPLYYMLQPQVKRPQDIPGCNIFSGFCDWFFYIPKP